MKELNVYLAVLLGLIVISFLGSCEKDEPAEPKGLKLTYGVRLDSITKVNNNWLSYEVMARKGDTLWYLDAYGNPIRRRDPITGEWDFRGIVMTEVSVGEQLINVAFKGKESLVQEKEKTITFFDENPDQKIYLAFPSKTRIISRVTADGKCFEKEIIELDNIRQRLVDNTSHTVSQEITVIHTQAETTWLLACKEDFIEKVLDPSKKSSSRAKAIVNQINQIDFDLVIKKVNYYSEKGIKPSPEEIRNLAKQITK